MNHHDEQFALASIRLRADSGSNDPRFYDALLAEVDSRERRWENPPL